MTMELPNIGGAADVYLGSIHFLHDRSYRFCEFLDPGLIYKCAISEWAFVIEIAAFLGIPKPIPAVRTIASAYTYCAV